MKILRLLVIAAIIAAAQSASAFDPKDILGGLAGAVKGSQSSEDTTQTTGSSESQSSGGILGAIGSFVNNVTANKKFSVDDLVGTWNYAGPCVTFQSENALKKIGGAGAATAVESKLEPYYKKLGFTRTTLTVDKEHNFVLKMGVLTLKGVVEKNDKDMLVFNFNAFGKVPPGSVAANATKSSSQLNLTFDATKMIQVLTKVASVLNSTSLNALTTLINSYDGIYMGFKLKADTKKK